MVRRSENGGVVVALRRAGNAILDYDLLNDPYLTQKKEEQRNVTK